MAYYLDLTPFAYHHDHPGEEHMLNVGWLEAGRPFGRGPVPYAFADELRLLAQKPVNLMRGFHVCDLCEPPRDLIASFPEYRHVWGMFRNGNGEIHVQSPSGAVYCAPILVLHYVAEHQYQPPHEFVDAVIFRREARLHQAG